MWKTILARLAVRSRAYSQVYMNYFLPRLAGRRLYQHTRGAVFALSGPLQRDRQI